MNKVSISGGLKEGSISMVVLNADGTVKRDLGVVAYTHRNPIKRWIKGTWIGLLANRRIKKLNGERTN